MKKNHAQIRRHGFFASTVRGFYILLLKTTLSEKIALPAIKATAKIIGRLIVAPAIPVDIPISIDRPKVNNITTKAYQPGKVPYRTVAMQPVQTWTPL